MLNAIRNLSRGSRWRRAARATGRISSDRRGVTAVEFGLVALPFFTLLFFILEMGMSLFAGQLIENATIDAARLIRTGQAQQNGFDAGAFKQQVLNRLYGIPFSAERLSIDVEKLDDFTQFRGDPLVVDGELQDNFAYDHGEAGDIIIVRVIYRWPLITSFMRLDHSDLNSGDRLLVSTAIFRNEPFPWKSK
ncbi:pilus assembly protein [Rhizobiales bacterium]|uniref:TadE/TadG family type IV pilus assembly protein n=1 Tax=Hongsoonwoonella zoysiae TaxID=2821844 RepID=UPI00155FDD79|nr:TadE/TadG family type IV pilus assembly protein [Hongsoonwoonella zoysiae]NRG16139.1 pilus assembly protein [Hongsoonwoonella zoysiae]